MSIVYRPTRDVRKIDSIIESGIKTGEDGSMVINGSRCFIR